MKLSKALSPLEDLRLAIGFGLVPTIKAVLRNPTLLFRPVMLSRVFMKQIWTPFGEGIDKSSRADKVKIMQHAYGKVLDIGAGHGHAVNYLEKARASAYIAVEPNELMHAEIRTRANAAGYTEAKGTLTILSCGAEEVVKILQAVDHVDTIISILTICSIPKPRENLTGLVKQVLKPGGQVLYYEHVQSPLSDVAWWQALWSPIWAIWFDGCRMDRPTHIWMKEMVDVHVHGKEVGMWKEQEMWGKEGEEMEHLFWHQSGRFVKHDEV